MLHQGWTRDKALDEMRNGQFGYHAVWGNIPRFLRKVDVEKLFTHRWTLEQAEEAYRLFDTQTTGKAVILPS